MLRTTTTLVRVARGLAIPVAGLLLLACGGAPSGAPTPEQHVQLRLGMLVNLTHATALVGVRQGLFANALGSSVTLQTSTFNAGPDEVTALLSSSIDAAYVGPNPAINAFTQSHGEAVRIVSGATSGGAALVVKPSITSAAELKGRTLATPQLGNTQDVALRYWLSKNGLRTDTSGGGDVSIHPQDNAQTLQTFEAGQLDGAWVPEPWASRMVDEGGGHVLVDERDLWPNRQFATTVLMVRTDYLRQYPDVVERLLQGQVAANQFLQDQPDAARKAANDQIAAVTGRTLSSKVVADAWTRMTFTDDPIASSLQTSAQHAHSVGLLGPVSLKGIVDLTLLNQVLTAENQPPVQGQ